MSEFLPGKDGEDPPQQNVAFPQIPGYLITSLLGSGPEAEVYKAHQLKLGRDVALKVLSPHHVTDKEVVNQFLREARAVARISHENIVAIYDVGVAGSWCFFAMEFVEGNSLEKLLQRGGALDEKRALGVVLQVARALDHAWTFQVVHRDIKPSNILINRRSVVKLCDLGFAKGVLRDDKKTAEGLTVGTPNYIAPEQAKGLAEVDIRGDIYSLGATLYHTVTGVPPFSGGSAADIMAKHVSEDPVPARERVSALSNECEYFIGKMMEKDPARRYEPAALVKDLDALFRNEFQAPAGSFSDSSLGSVSQETKEGKKSGKSSSELRPLRRRHKGRRVRRPRRRR
ncbi:MAG: serine/threonine protein kinase [Planctomycetota bacterium]|jgi:serine/threonine-protein kinase